MLDCKEFSDMITAVEDACAHMRRDDGTMDYEEFDRLTDTLDLFETRGVLLSVCLDLAYVKKQLDMEIEINNELLERLADARDDVERACAEVESVLKIVENFTD